MGNDLSMINAISKVGGMSYSIADEQKVKNDIKDHNYDITFTSQYADVVCKNNAENLEFLAQQFPPDIIPDFSNPNCHNPTSYGNVAYIALHAPHPYNKIAEKQYNMIINTPGHF